MSFETNLYCIRIVLTLKLISILTTNLAIIFNILKSFIKKNIQLRIKQIKEIMF